MIMPKLSIIVPVCDARDYVIPCVESLLNQTLNDIEIVFSDDNGKDDSMAAIQEMTARYTGTKRIVFTRTPSNAGPGTARNAGLEVASGEYVAFVDSDDCLEPGFCECLLRAAETHDADLAYCSIRFYNTSNGTSLVKSNPPVTSGVFQDADRRRFLVSFVSFFTTFLYRRAFLNEHGIRFPSTRSSEDSAFLAACILAASKIAVVPQPLYRYNQRFPSLSSRKDPGRYLQRIQSFNSILDYAQTHGYYSALQQEIDFLYIKKAFLMACKTYADNERKPSATVLKGLSEDLEQKLPAYRKNLYLKKSPKVRLAVWLIRHQPHLACLVLKTINA